VYGSDRRARGQQCIGDGDGWENAIEIVELANEIPEYGSSDDIGFATIRTEGLAYRLASSLDSIDTAYIRAGQPHRAGWDVYVLRLPDAEQVPGKQLGASLHFEPIVEDTSDDGVTPFLPTCGLSQTPLSDMYYRLVQDAYYCLAERDWSYGHIGRQIMDYMSWASYSWRDYERALR
jgi:hypothetical protein